ncbi:MAG: hypothetical protein KJ558_09200 [Gammaproteobacteria bacterium]|nr:hypothetical protein [Gammaproteobacteria bacterium]MBU1654984.1 hypothetical protein [Gammaproteobacteria bacterium]MBU1962336.1 hypothetical protein [Gammaproteobacteria bacterium]
MKTRYFLCLFLLLWAPISLAGHPLKIIELKASLPEEILPAIQPLLEPGENISAARHMLLLRAAPERVQEIQQVIEQLDRPARKLMITVSRGASEQIERERFSAGADARIGESSVVVGRPPRRGGAEIRFGEREAVSNEAGDQRIQTLEGRPAFIHSGSSIPVPERTTLIRGGTIVTQRTTAYRDALQGFYVVPRVVGDQVTLEIHQQHDQPAAQRGAIRLQHADTVVSGRLGDWISLGGIRNEVRQEERSLTGYNNRQSSQNLDLRVRVTELP